MSFHSSSLDGLSLSEEQKALEFDGLISAQKNQLCDASNSDECTLDSKIKEI